LRQFLENRIERLIKSAHHPLIKHGCQLRDSKSYRQEHQRFLYDATDLVEEVPAHGIRRIICTEDFLDRVKGEVHLVPGRLMEKLSPTRRSSGILFECQLPETLSLQSGEWEGASRILVIDQVQDPGNLGNLMRSAVAFGWTTLLFLGAGCDPWNEKVLRAARGAHFHLLFSEADPIVAGEWFQERKIALFIGAPHGNTSHLLTPPPRCGLVVSNEGKGMHPALKGKGMEITIPMHQGVESLNVAVAGGILMYLLQNREMA
jgi:TrmH family RNA methyltransferase